MNEEDDYMTTRLKDAVDEYLNSNGSDELDWYDDADEVEVVEEYDEDEYNIKENIHKLENGSYIVEFHLEGNSNGIFGEDPILVRTMVKGKYQVIHLENITMGLKESRGHYKELMDNGYTKVV